MQTTTEGAVGPSPTIGRTTAESTPHFPRRPKPVGAPNVLVILLDDVGFAQLGAFGAPFETPAMDRLARDGVRFNRFHVTALCSPSRAALLTGRNHHRVGMGFLTDIPFGFPGYSARIPTSAATLARVLRDAGYNTFAVGKWHLTPRDDRSASGPFDTWPLGQGFERYYGFLHGDANHWTPNLVSDNHVISPPRGPDDGYHLTEDLVDQALGMVADQHHATPDKPFFLYLATGAAHAPHHVGREWADAYRGRFDDGWERVREETFARQRELGVVPETTALGPRPPWIDDWDSLSGPERRLFARFQEVFAGFMSHTDAQIGRLLDGMARLGVLDDTVVLLMSDNGASAEGGRIGSVNEHRFAFGGRDDLADNLAGLDELGGHRAYNHYPWGWAWAGNTPFRLWKRYSWLGGTRTPLIVRRPAGTDDAGSIRGQFCHIVDIFPTVLELCGIDAPEEVDGVAQLSVDGTSLVPVLEDGDAPEVRSSQYFEMLGSRSMYLDGWKATTDHISRGVQDEQLIDGSRDLDEDRWSLFDLSEDFAESLDLAEQHPEVVERLDAAWWTAAEANQVLPIEDDLIGRLPAMEPPLWRPPTRLELLPGFGPLADEFVPSLAAGCLLTADVDVPIGRPAGVLCALGDWTNGWALAVLDGRLAFLLNVAGDSYRFDAPGPLPPGRRSVGFRFDPADRTAALYVDEEVVRAVRLPAGVGASGAQIGGGGLRLGHDEGFPVTPDYQPPFAWNGTLHKVSFDRRPGEMVVSREDLEDLLRRE